MKRAEARTSLDLSTLRRRIVWFLENITNPYVSNTIRKEEHKEECFPVEDYKL